MTRSFYVKFVAVIAALTAMPAFVAFFDSFEDASLNPFWTVSDNRLSTGTLLDNSSAYWNAIVQDAVASRGAEIFRN